MAEFIFKKMLSERGLSDRFSADSRATSAEELGNPVYPPARAELLRHGIRCEGKYAVQLTRSDYDKYDLLIGMDSANIRNMHRLFSGDPCGKIHKLMDYTARGGDVADPWYSGNFEVTYKDVSEGCSALLASLLEKDL
jgi:protein-tyrosine phosphatase